MPTRPSLHGCFAIHSMTARASSPSDSNGARGPSLRIARDARQREHAHVAVRRGLARHPGSMRSSVNSSSVGSVAVLGASRGRTIVAAIVASFDNRDRDVFVDDVAPFLFFREQRSDDAAEAPIGLEREPRPHEVERFVERDRRSCRAARRARAGGFRAAARSVRGTSLRARRRRGRRACSNVVPERSCRKRSRKVRALGLGRPRLHVDVVDDGAAGWRRVPARSAAASCNAMRLSCAAAGSPAAICSAARFAR